jgi:hypothetical protein
MMPTAFPSAGCYHFEGLAFPERVVKKQSIEQIVNGNI